MKSADGFILFPGSDHIETVVVFNRVNTGAYRQQQ